MEENNNNGFEMNTNMNQTNATVNKQKKSKLVPVLVLIIIMLIVLLVLCVGNKYALMKDYDNVFSMAASMIIGKEVENEEENTNIVNSDGQNNTIKIEGEYLIVGNDNSEGLTYKFEGNTVTFIATYITKGTYDVVDNKIKITYSEAYENGETIDFPNGQYEELTIVDENTLTSKKTINGVVTSGTYVKDSKFVSENPKISFQYPKEWTIETNSWNIWNRTVRAPEAGVKIIIKKEENQGNAELKDLISLDGGSNVLDEGTISTANNYKNYFKTYIFADAEYAIKAKNVIIDTGKGDYYSISLIVGGENMLNMSHEQVFNKYESVLNKLVGTVQF